MPAVPSLPAAGCLPALRAATRAHHERLDRLIDLRRLRDARRYARVLQVLDGFLAAWEPCVTPALPPAWHAWLRQRSRRPFLQQDLRVLGLAAGAHPGAMSPFATAGAAWGSVYVIEGSALGGQAITRSLADAGLRPDRGAAYFHGWGTATGAMWKEVRTLLDQQLADPHILVQACEGACATFDALALHLEIALHERPPLA
ncbi:biliverdin-producing heme oxygenase [Ramlibacter sp. AN1133]|uniref:biliverdin-producing heme oxygenase n=1 Tax=Ramlibacter sp. AN1133 TaxID=3133429 RepID=UPI0030C2926D